MHVLSRSSCRTRGALLLLTCCAGGQKWEIREAAVNSQLGIVERRGLAWLVAYLGQVNAKTGLAFSLIG
jgi:hypothetical protein